MGKFFKLKINKGTFEKQVSKGLGSKSIKDKAYDRAEEVAKDAKDELVKEFNSHVITKEIDAGASNTKNISRNLLGLPYGEGSLFGFIGFDNSSNPTSEVKSYLKSTGHVSKRTRLQRKGTRRGLYNFKVEVPNMNQIDSLTPMPWEGGRSWVRAIERGISGLSYYLARQLSQSRSGQGLQSRNTVNSGAMYKPSKYMSEMINHYIRRLQGRKIKR
tara:strand:+ start:803 stop:1450 length:648 start_codon:yes stop_codon:yes gene_type:complete